MCDARLSRTYVHAGAVRLGGAVVLFCQVSLTTEWDVGDALRDQRAESSQSKNWRRDLKKSMAKDQPNGQICIPPARRRFTGHPPESNES